MTPPGPALRPATEDRRENPEDKINAPGILTRAARENTPIEHLKLREGDDREVITSVVRAYAQYLMGQVGRSPERKPGTNMVLADSHQLVHLGPDEQGLTPVDYSDLASLLAEKGISLESILSEHLDMLVEKGILEEKNRHFYSKKFDMVWINCNEIQNVPDGYIPLIYIDNQDPVKLANAFGVGGKEFLVKCKKNRGGVPKARLIFVDTSPSAYKQGEKYLQPDQFLLAIGKQIKRPWMNLRLPTYIQELLGLDDPKNISSWAGEDGCPRVVFPDCDTGEFKVRYGYELDTVLTFGMMGLPKCYKVKRRSGELGCNYYVVEARNRMEKSNGNFGSTNIDLKDLPFCRRVIG